MTEYENEGRDLLESMGVATERRRVKDYPDILDAIQMADLLQISKKTAYRILQENKLPFLRIGKQYRIPKSSVLRFLRLMEK